MDTGPFYIHAGNRCAVDFSTLQLPFSDEKAISLLLGKGFKLIENSLTALARQCLATSKYVRLCRAEEAPQKVDCSSFTKWLYAQKGIWLPRHPVDQRYLGFQEIPLDSDRLQEGDLIFSAGGRNLYWSDPKKGIGHVGMITSNQTVIHATSSIPGVAEISIAEAAATWEMRGACRIIPNPQRTWTFEFPHDQLVEYSAAFRWKLLSRQNPLNF